MDKLQVFFLITSAIVLFLYGLNHFSQEMESIGKERLHGKLNNFVSNRWRGFALGATFTAAVQSSSAASALAVSLVNAGLISFQNSLASRFFNYGIKHWHDGHCPHRIYGNEYRREKSRPCELDVQYFGGHCFLASVNPTAHAIEVSLRQRWANCSLHPLGIQFNGLMRISYFS